MLGIGAALLLTCSQGGFDLRDPASQAGILLHHSLQPLLLHTHRRAGRQPEKLRNLSLRLAAILPQQPPRQRANPIPFAIPTSDESAIHPAGIHNVLQDFLRAQPPAHSAKRDIFPALTPVQQRQIPILNPVTEPLAPDGPPAPFQNLPELLV